MAVSSYDEAKAVFAKVLGRDPSQAEVEDVIRVKEAFGLTWRDPSIGLFMATSLIAIAMREAPKNYADAAQAVIGVATRDAAAKLTAEADVVRAELAKHAQVLDEASRKATATVEAAAGKAQAKYEQALAGHVVNAAAEFNKRVEQGIAETLARSLVPVLATLKADMTNAASECVAKVDESARRAVSVIQSASRKSGLPDWLSGWPWWVNAIAIGTAILGLSLLGSYFGSHLTLSQFHIVTHG